MTLPRAASVRALADFLSRRASGEKLAIEAFAAERPEIRDELLGLHRTVSAEPGAESTLSIARSDPEATVALGPADASASRSFEAGELIGRGAMGAVLKVWDEPLRRNLAMKVILDKHREGGLSSGAVVPEVLTRFRDEAQVTGQLDHPGVVPVHEYGEDRGQPYFTMRLVRGRSFREIAEDARAERDGWNLPRAVGTILKVCETMAFAHAKGVVHRDLKPSNVMVGRFGETYVMDWGLARVAGEEDRHDLRLRGGSRDEATWVRTDRAEADDDSGSPLVTMDGTVVGTPYYMPPEQAAGRVDEIGPWSDVYSVGAMLYHLLTGYAPYASATDQPSARTVVAMVLHGAPTPVHAWNADTPPELAAICEKAMERRPLDRYASMEAMAEDLRAYLEGRVVKAHATGPIAEMKKWVQCNRAFAATTAAMFLVAVAGTIAFMLRLQEERGRAERNAIAASKHADQAFQALNTLAREVQHAMADLPGREVRAVRTSLLTIALEGLRELPADIYASPGSRTAAEAHRWMGSLASQMGDTREAFRHYENALAASEELVASSPGDLEARIDLLDSRLALAKLADSLEAETDEIRLCDEAIELARDILASEPENLLVQRMLASALIARSGAQAKGDVRGSRGFLSEASELRRAILASEPDDARLKRDLAFTLGSAARNDFIFGDHDVALPKLEEALALMREYAENAKLRPSEERQYSMLLSNLGYAYLTLERPKQAREVLEEAVVIARELMAADDEDADNRNTAAEAFQSLGDVYWKSRAFPLAERLYTDALEIRRAAFRDAPDSPDNSFYLVQTLLWLAEIHVDSGNGEAGVPFAEEAVDVYRALVEENPSSYRRQALAYWLAEAAGVYLNGGLIDAARTAAHESLDLGKELCEENPLALEDMIRYTRLAAQYYEFVSEGADPERLVRMQRDAVPFVRRLVLLGEQPRELRGQWELQLRHCELLWTRAMEAEEHPPATPSEHLAFAYARWHAGAPREAAPHFEIALRARELANEVDRGHLLHGAEAAALAAAGGDERWNDVALDWLERFAALCEERIAGDPLPGELGATFARAEREDLLERLQAVRDDVEAFAELRSDARFVRLFAGIESW